jgi:preprotein translocase subunit SecA
MPSFEARTPRVALHAPHARRVSCASGGGLPASSSSTPLLCRGAAPVHSRRLVTVAAADSNSSLRDARRVRASASAASAPAGEAELSSAQRFAPPRFVDDPVAAVREWVRSRSDNSTRTVRRLLSEVVEPTNVLEAATRALSDEALAQVTVSLRAQLEAGASLDELLPQAFAAVREASRRWLGLRPYDVQLMGAAVLHEGAVAEMRTGEGKTLVAVLAAYLNALPRTGVHVVTVNDYLATRDATWMGRIYRALGMTCGCVTSTTPGEERAGPGGYGADVTYVTNSELGFDYLRDNMAHSAQELRHSRPFAFALVDEVDSVLIDEGRNPLLISTVEEAGTERYPAARDVASALVEAAHYTVDRKARNVTLTEAGMVAAERLLGIADLWAGSDPWAKYVLNALRAKELYLRDVQYIVRDGQVAIVDEFTGRVFPNRRWTDNIHQAVECKEGVPVQGEQVTAATITYQSFFKLYPKLAGMTGTARTEDEEFWRMYRLDVVTVPTHRPCIRSDLPTAIFRMAEPKWAAVVDFVAEQHEEGFPVLVGTTSVEHTELLSSRLRAVSWVDAAGRRRTGVPHNLLNARAQYAAQEAAIIAQAGRSGAVTISTNMAGRGTDILLGGNPVGLARQAVTDAMWQALQLTVLPSVDAAGAPVPLEQATHAALRAAAAIAAPAVRAALPPDADTDALVTACGALVDRVIDAAEARTRPNGDSHADTLLGDVPPEQQTAVRALLAAACAALRDCTGACALDGARVRARGGLQVVGTQVHESRRIDNQLRGRAGRQGDPGRTIFVLSLEDELLRVHCPEWAMRPVWDVAGLPPDAPVSSAMVDSQITGIQTRIERYYAGARRSVAEYDEVLSLHRNNAYTLRRALLLDGNEALRKRVFRYFTDLVDEAAAAADISASVSPTHWDVPSFLTACRNLTAGRSNRLRLDQGLEPLDPPQLLPGVRAEDLQAALVRGTPLPVPYVMPPPAAHPAAVAAAMAGIPWWDDSLSEEERSDAAALNMAGAMVLGTRIQERVQAALPGLRGRYAVQATLIRAYVLEHADAMYGDRCERLLARGVSAPSLEEAERLWILKALDERWQRHIATMTVLRNSVNLRAFGLLEPLEEYNVDGVLCRALLPKDARISLLTSPGVRLLHLRRPSLRPVRA